MYENIFKLLQIIFITWSFIQAVFPYIQVWQRCYIYGGNKISIMQFQKRIYMISRYFNKFFFMKRTAIKRILENEENLALTLKFESSPLAYNKNDQFALLCLCLAPYVLFQLKT